MKILFDTCVVVDILGRTSHFADSYIAYDIACFKKMDVFLSASSTTDIVYLLQSRGFSSKRRAREIACELPELFDILDNISEDCRQAAASDMADYEDALIAYAAARQGIDFVITRNKKDFAHSPVPALTPAEFVALHKPACLDYAETELDCWEKDE